jgi:hypothetical protein
MLQLVIRVTVPHCFKPSQHLKLLGLLDLEDECGMILKKYQKLQNPTTQQHPRRLRSQATLP